MSTLQSNESGGAHSRPDLTADHTQLIHRLFEQVYSEGRLHIAADLVDSEFVGTCTGTNDSYHGPGGVKTHATRLRAAFYDLTFTVDTLRATPVGIEVRWTARGRLERPIMGISPDCSIGPAGAEPGGPDITVSGRSRLTVSGEKVRESHMDWDVAALHAQATSPANTVDR